MYINPNSKLSLQYHNEKEETIRVLKGTLYLHHEIKGNQVLIVSKLVEGDKIFIINLKENPYKLETVGLPNAKVPDEIEKFVKTYIDVDEIFESLLLNKLKELYKDLNWSFPSLNANVDKFFSF